MRISDWSSDVCPADLPARRLRLSRVAGKPGRVGACASLPARFARSVRNETGLPLEDDTCVLPCCFRKCRHATPRRAQEIGRALCRERVWTYVTISVVAVSVKKKH